MVSKKSNKKKALCELMKKSPQNRALKFELLAWGIIGYINFQNRIFFWAYQVLLELTREDDSISTHVRCPPLVSDINSMLSALFFVVPWQVITKQWHPRRCGITSRYPLSLQKIKLEQWCSRNQPAM